VRKGVSGRTQSNKCVMNWSVSVSMLNFLIMCVGTTRTLSPQSHAIRIGLFGRYGACCSDWCATKQHHLGLPTPRTRHRAVVLCIAAVWHTLNNVKVGGEAGGGVICRTKGLPEGRAPFDGFSRHESC
jgi:hypothetical protein